MSMHRLAPKAARAASATSRSLSTTTPARLSATAPALALNPNAPDVPDFAQKKRERKRSVPGKVPDKNVGKDARKHAFHPSPHAPAKAAIFQEWHVPELVVPTIQTVKKAPGAGAFDTSRPEHPFNHFGLPKKQIAEVRGYTLRRIWGLTVCEVPSSVEAGVGRARDHDVHAGLARQGSQWDVGGEPQAGNQCVLLLLILSCI